MSENFIGATTAIFPIRLSVAVASPVDVEWATRDGSAIAGSDYKAASGTVTFLPGETEKQIEVQVYGQAITPADDKVFFIRLNPPSNAVLVDAILTCTINIIDDQGIPSVAVVVAEGRRGPKGDPGISAYDQAVLMGYTGTLAEWMDQIADASKAADRAEDYAISAGEDALKAQNAAKNAVFAGVIFPTTAEGVDPILGVQNGAYFNVRSPLSDHYIDEYQNVNGVAVATGKSYPTAEHFQNISEHTALPFVTGESYALNRRVQLDNGDIVKSTIAGNTNDPNVDMTGWVKTSDASQIFDANGESQQIINDSNSAGKVYFSSFGAKTIEQTPDFDCTSIFQIAMYACAQTKKQLCINVSGTYRVNADGVKSSLTGAVQLDSTYSGLTVVGEGDIIIKAIGSNDDFFSMFKIVLDAKNIQFHFINFDGNGTKYFSSLNTNQFENGYSAFNIKSNSNDAVEDILFYNCKFLNTAESAITSYGSSGTPLPHYFSNRIQFLFCHFENIGAHGIGMNEFRNSNASTCTFKNVGMKRLVGAIGSGYAIDVSGGCEDVTVSGCTVDGAGGGFKAETHTYSGGTVDQAAKNIVFLNNHVKNLHKNNRYPDEDFASQYPAFRINGIGCQIIGGSIEAYGHGIWFSGKAKDCSASGVTITKTVAPNTDAIFFENGSDTYGNNSAQNNIITNAARNGVNLQGFNNTASSNKISGCGVGGLHINYARNAKAKNNECFNNNGYGIRVSKKTERASLIGNDCYDTRSQANKTQKTGIQVATVYDEASDIQVQANNVYDNAANDYLMSEINTFTLNHFGFKEVYAGEAPLGGLWRNGDRVIQSFYGAGRTKGWVCSAKGGATRGVLAVSTAVSVGQWYQWSTGTTVWEVTIAGTTASTAPDITGKVVGDTVVHGTATLTMRATTIATFVSDGNY